MYVSFCKSGQKPKSGYILAGFVKMAGFRPEPKFGTALLEINGQRLEVEPQGHYTRPKTPGPIPRPPHEDLGRKKTKFKTQKEQILSSIITINIITKLNQILCT